MILSSRNLLFVSCMLNTWTLCRLLPMAGLHLLFKENLAISQRVRRIHRFKLSIYIYGKSSIYKWNPKEKNLNIHQGATLISEYKPRRNTSCVTFHHRIFLPPAIKIQHFIWIILQFQGKLLSNSVITILTSTLKSKEKIKIFGRQYLTTES